MLSSINGKYLSRRWAEMREQALQDPTRFTAWELEWLEVSVFPRRATDETFLTDTQPADPRTKRRRGVVDIRDLEGH